MIILVLTLPQKRLKSKPVTFTMSDGRATPRSIIFEMQDIK